MGFSLGAIAGMVNPVGAIGTVGAGLLGGGLDYIGQQQTNRSNEAIADKTNAAQMALANQNIELQKEFAQNGITWRIADAARNGISPLAALGAAEPGFSPVMPVMAIPSYESPLKAAAPSFETAGQNLSRALLTTQDPYTKASQALDLARRSKENDLLDLQIKNAQLNLASSSSPGLPLAWTTVMNRDGTTSIVPSEQAARASHGETFGPLLWSIHNGMIPSVGDVGRAASYYLDTPDVRGSRFFGTPGNYYSTGGAR